MIVKAIQQLRPTSEWLLNGEEYAGLVWLGDDDKPTEEEVQAVITELLKANNDLAG
jgi:hypothetical protein